MSFTGWICAGLHARCARAPPAPAPAASNYDINALGKQPFELQKLMREAQQKQRAEETSQAEAKPTSEPGAGPLEASSSLFVFCKRTS